MGVLLEIRYRHTNDLDDLQAAITWAEQEAAPTQCTNDQVLCLSNLISRLVAKYEQTGELGVLREAVERLREVKGIQDNLPLSSRNILDIASVRDTFERLIVVLESYPPASHDSISATISDLVFLSTEDTYFSIMPSL